MKKIIIWTSLILSTIWLSFALSSNDLKNSLNNSYNNAITSWTNLYNKYKNIIKNINEKISTWDYTILSQLTWVNSDNLNNNIKTAYINLIQKITTDKLNILWKIEINDNNFSNNLITTWEYNNKLNDIQSQISGYILTENTNIKNFAITSSWAINSFDNNLQNKLSYYKTAISNYKIFKNKLIGLENNYNKLINSYNKLNKTIWIWKEVLAQKSDELKQNITNYYSWMLNNEFQKYVQEDANMTYFQSGFEIKKEVLLGFVNDKLVSTITNVINTYYPDVNISEITTGVNNLKSEKISDIIKNYNSILKQITSLQNKITTAQNKVNEKLNKLWWNKSQIDIFKILENDIITNLNNVTKVVQDDIKQTLKNYFNFIKTKEKVEQPIMTQLMLAYNKKMSANNLTGLTVFVETLNNYKNIINLPENIDTINKYIKAVNTEIENLKFQEITNKLKTLKSNIENLQISNNFSKINELSWEIAKLESTVPNQFKTELQQDKYLLKMKANLNKLFKVWAIRFYYQNWDLSNVVANILKKYYDKYKSENKENIFNEKINKAFEKLEILESSLKNDLRSYYIIMIDNGLLKFKSDLLK